MVKFTMERYLIVAFIYQFFAEKQTDACTHFSRSSGFRDLFFLEDQLFLILIHTDTMVNPLQDNLSV